MSFNAFSNLRYAHVCALLDTVSKDRIRRIPHIRRLFIEKAEGFDEVVLFLSELGMLSIDGDILHLKADWSTSDSAKRRDEIIRMLIDKKNRYRTEAYKFINKFSVVHNDIVYMPPDQSRSSESGVRNFLIDLGVVIHLLETNKYVLVPEYVNLLASAKNSANYTSPALLEKNVEFRNELGYAAEEQIVKYERQRIGPEYADKVDHVSMRNSAAGYDIQSISIETNGQVFPRFIEVKAVSPRTLQFYWSKNEVTTARTLSHWYYLYLLPVNRKGQFNTDRLMVIPDPCNTILKEDSNWVTETDALVCYIKSATLN